MTTLPQSTFRFILHFVAKQWVKFALLALTGVVWSINDTFFPFFIKRIVDTLQNYHGLSQHIYAALTPTLILLVVFWLTSELVLRGQGVLQIYTIPKFRANIREEVFTYVKSHSHEYFSNNFAGNVAKKLADLPTSSQTLVEIFYFQFVTAFVGAIIILVMMWLAKPLFAVILFVWLCIHLGVTFLFLKSGDHLWEIHSNAVTTLSGKIVDVFNNMQNVRLFSRESFESTYLKRYQQDEIKKAKTAMWNVEIMRVCLGLNGLALIFSMIFSLVYGYVHGFVTLGDFTQVGMQTFWLLGWIWYVSFQLSIVARESGTISNALGLIRKAHDVIDVPRATPIIISKGDIRFENVSFAYVKHKYIFDHFNLHIPAGEKVGLVGFSGSGKSTFVNLILRFYDVQKGKILIDDQDIHTIKQQTLRAQIGMIPQDPALFHRSLMENIRYGRLDATDEEVIQAATLAHCHEFIDKLDEGYQALVGERGIKLSGGQRQRIAIARAILKNAPILILDEATSSLDSVTEKLIQQSLHLLMEKRTTIVVAHRLSTLANMDRILVFDQGKIIESGTKESLLAQKGHFAMLWNMQTDGFLPDKK